MRRTVKKLLVLLLSFLPLCYAFAQNIKPVNKNSSPEAVALLKLLYDISGEYLLTGQHNFPKAQNRNTEFASKYIGKTPVVFSTDWGFAEENNYDSYLARPAIVKEAIRQHKLGSIITICWHAVPPTADEPVTFQPRPGADPGKLESVQGKLTDQQFRDILTPGTALYRHWAQQVDTVAHYLKQLQEAHVPVLWRPYHEMNGDWFWWGGRTGEYSTRRLYRQLFDRMVHHHKLNNLVWVWSVDRPSTPARAFSNFYPGNEYLDVLSLDVYGSDFNQNYYDSLLVLSKGKPVSLAEVGDPPTPAILKLQPKWTWHVIWAGMVRNTLKKQYDVLARDSRVLFMEDAAYRRATEAYHKASGIAPLPGAKTRFPDFSGRWIFHEEESTLDNRGTGNIPALLEVVQHENGVTIKRTTLSEFAANEVSEQELSLDGVQKAFKAPFGNAPMMVSAHRSAGGDTLYLASAIQFVYDNRTREISSLEKWMTNNGRLIIDLASSGGFGGTRKLRLVYFKGGAIE